MVILITLFCALIGYPIGMWAAKNPRSKFIANVFGTNVIIGTAAVFYMCSEVWHTGGIATFVLCVIAFFAVGGVSGMGMDRIYFGPKLKKETYVGGKGKYDIDRLVNIHKFYTAKPNANSLHEVKEGTVLTPSNDHDSNGWITLGFVSYDTPLGQGTFLGYRLSELQPATPLQIRNALRTPHPHGLGFRPHCREASFDAKKKHDVILRNWKMITSLQKQVIMQKLWTTRPIAMVTAYLLRA